MLGEHSHLRSYSDLTSYWMLAKLAAGWRCDYNFCVKPMDLFFLSRSQDLSIYRHFNKFLWIARDPRDSYLSGLEAGYAYLFWFPGRKEEGIDIGLLRRWLRVYRHYFGDRNRWYLVRYEDLVKNPHRVLGGIFQYLELPFENVVQFGRHKRLKGGDYKIRRTLTVHTDSVSRHQSELSPTQLKVFQTYLGPEMEALGYR